MTDGWTQIKPLAIGDKFTMPNKYKPRTFLQWLKRKPRELQVFEVRSVSSSYCEYEKKIIQKGTL